MSNKTLSPLEIAALRLQIVKLLRLKEILKQTYLACAVSMVISKDLLVLQLDGIATIDEMIEPLNELLNQQ